MSDDRVQRALLYDSEMCEVQELRALMASAQQKIDHITFGGYWGADSNNRWLSMLRKHVRPDVLEEIGSLREELYSMVTPRKFKFRRAIVNTILDPAIRNSDDLVWWKQAFKLLVRQGVYSKCTARVDAEMIKKMIAVIRESEEVR
tara:strand:- start:1082 stop:1519 length:438 start_codon:yes stop_codon:yes gene_type:complete